MNRARKPAAPVVPAPRFAGIPDALLDAPESTGTETAPATPYGASADRADPRGVFRRANAAEESETVRAVLASPSIRPAHAADTPLYPPRTPRKLAWWEPAALYCDGGLLGPNPNEHGGTWAWCFVNADGERIAERAEREGMTPEELTALLADKYEYAPERFRWVEGVGLLLPRHVRPFSHVSNNLTELVAMLRGLRSLPAGWRGTVYSDSHVTICHVAGYRYGDRLQREKLLETTPESFIDVIAAERARAGRLDFVLLDGHPNREQLAAGIGKRGNPVSQHNVWCDQSCTNAKVRFWEESRAPEQEPKRRPDPAKKGAPHVAE